MIWVFIAVVVVGLIFLIVYNARASRPKTIDSPESESPETGESLTANEPTIALEEGADPAAAPADTERAAAPAEHDEPQPNKAAGDKGRYVPPKRVKTPAAVKLARDNDFRSSLLHLSNKESDDILDKMKSDHAYRDALRAMNRQASREKGD
ncbi:hypothetical protein ACFSL6_07830 [Paenibacillus thailandensis]|uniref:Uncharacterized protein n=1 Tax=Paenibacillus thailandensis TaxID=393250 RepID=A0ABW5QVG9_9BACL